MTTSEQQIDYIRGLYEPHHPGKYLKGIIESSLPLLTVPDDISERVRELTRSKSPQVRRLAYEASRTIGL